MTCLKLWGLVASQFSSLFFHHLFCIDQSCSVLTDLIIDIESQYKVREDAF